MVQPDFVMRGFSAEPVCCCTWLTEEGKSFIAVGLQTGFLEVWRLSDLYRPVYKSQEPIFQSAFLSLRYAGQNLVIAESKIHQLSIFLVSNENNQVSLTMTELYRSPSSDTIPSFCQSDFLDGKLSVVENDGIAVKQIEKLENSIGITPITHFEPQFGKVGSPMFATFIPGSDKIICGFESNDIAVWSTSAPFSLIDRCSLQKYDQKEEFCPVCSAACGEIIEMKRKPAFAVIGTTSNLVFKVTFDENFKMKLDSIKISNAAGVTSVSIRQDRKLACFGCSNGSIVLLSPKSLSILGELTYHRENYSSLSRTISSLSIINIRGDTAAPHWLLLCCSRDRSISSWNIYNQ